MNDYAKQTQFIPTEGGIKPNFKRDTLPLCGGYITKGTSICRMNAIPKEVLESNVIETVLDFYFATAFLSRPKETR